jgi:hypothetical protein
MASQRLINIAQRLEELREASRVALPCDRGAIEHERESLRAQIRKLQDEDFAEARMAPLQEPRRPVRRGWISLERILGCLVFMTLGGLLAWRG